MKRRIWILAMGLAAAALAMAGCGSSASSSSETTGPLTKAEFLKQGDQICAAQLKVKDQAVKKALEETPAKELPNPSKQRVKEIGESILPPLKSIVNDLGELEPPAKDQAKVEKMVADLEAGLQKAEANPGVLTKSDPFEKGSSELRAYGFKNCVL